MSAQVSWIKSRYIIACFLSTFPFCFQLGKLFLVLLPKLRFAALHAKKLPYSTPNLAAFKGRINCSLCTQFGTGVHSPLCVLGSLLFKIAVYHWCLHLTLNPESRIPKIDCYGEQVNIRNEPNSVFA